MNPQGSYCSKESQQGRFACRNLLHPQTTLNLIIHS